MRCAGVCAPDVAAGSCEAAGDKPPPYGVAANMKNAQSFAGADDPDRLYGVDFGFFDAARRGLT